MLNHIATELPSVTHHLREGGSEGGEDTQREIEIGTPKGLGYFEEHHVQIIEDFPGTVDFETLLLEEHMDEKILYGIGEALGVRFPPLHF